MSKYIYLGPYFECTYKKATRIEHVFGCSWASCKKHPKTARPPAEGKFCSTCGAPNGHFPIEVPDRPHHYDVVRDELFDIELEAVDLIYLAPNVRRAGDPRRDLDNDKFFHLDLRDVDPRSEMVWLETAFAPELKKLRKAYETVSVKWGLHQYFR